MTGPEQVGEAVGRALAGEGITPSFFPEHAPDHDPRRQAVHVREHERRYPVRRTETIGGNIDRNVTQTGRRNPSTSHAAAARVFPRIGSMRRQVIEWLNDRGDINPGATDDEIERHFGWTHQSASACRNGLMNDGWVEDSGAKRLVVRSGNEAIVWILTAKARVALDVA